MNTKAYFFQHNFALSGPHDSRLENAVVVTQAEWTQAQLAMPIIPEAAGVPVFGRFTNLDNREDVASDYGNFLALLQNYWRSEDVSWNGRFVSRFLCKSSPIALGRCRRELFTSWQDGHLLIYGLFVHTCPQDVRTVVAGFEGVPLATGGPNAYPDYFERPAVVEIIRPGQDEDNAGNARMDLANRNLENAFDQGLREEPGPSTRGMRRRSRSRSRNI